MTHACPVPGCTQQLHREVLMCATHWLMVPKPLRLAVCASWHAASRIVGPRDEVRKRHAQWRKARDAAVAAVRLAAMPCA